MIFTKQKKQFLPQVRALNKGQNIDSQLIWRAFQGAQSEQDVYYFCNQLFQHLIQSDKKTYLLQNEQRIYATLLFMEFYKNRKKKKLETIQLCGKFIEEMQSSPGKSFLQFLFLRKRQEYGQFFIGRLSMVPSNLTWSSSIEQQMNNQLSQQQQYLRSRGKHSSSHKNYQTYKYANHPKLLLSQPKLLTFGYLCFIDHIRNNKYQLQPQQYHYLGECLKYLMHTVETIPATQELLPNLIHLIMKCVTFYGCPDQTILKGFLVWADKLREFTGLVGNIGGYFFNLVFQELKLPGFAFRKKLQKDFTSLGIKENVFINKPFYLVTDQQQIYSRQEDISISTLRKLIIVNTLKCCGFPSNQFTQFTLQLRSFSRTTTFTLYDKLMRILDVISKLDCRAKIKQVLNQYIPKLINETILKNQQAEKSNQSLQQEQFDMLLKKMSKTGFFEYPAFEIITVPIADFVSNKEGVYNLARIIQKNRADYQAKGLFKNKIPLAFHGDGNTLVKFIRTISNNLQQSPLEQLKQFQIFYLPKHESTCRPGIGLYLSRKDSWYRKFVYNVHYERILYPHLDLNQHTKDLFPFYLYSKNVQMFLREANWAIPIRVYKCNLKISQIEKEEELYLTSYLCMGLFYEARIIKMQKQKQRNKEQKQYNKQLIQIIQEKIKKIRPISISIDVDIVEPLTGNIRNKKQTSILVEDLQICNLPCEYFMGKQPIPDSPNLQMTILTERNGKIFRKQIGRSEYFKQSKPFDQMYQAFKDLFICRTIRSITIQNLDLSNNLKVLIDGNIANNIEKITIKPAISTSGVPVVLQMQSFLPVC